MNKTDLLKEYDKIHSEFFGQYANMLTGIYKSAIDSKVLNNALVEWKRVHETNKYMNFDIGESASECLGNFIKHAKYMQEDDVLEREFDECIQCEHDYMTDDIDEIEKYGISKEKIWSKFVASINKLPIKYK